MGRRPVLLAIAVGCALAGVALRPIPAETPATTPGPLPENTAAAIAGLERGFFPNYGLGGSRRNILVAEFAKNRGAIGLVLDFARESDANAASLAHALSEYIHAYARKYARGTMIPREDLLKDVRKFSDSPHYGVEIRAYLLLQSAYETQSRPRLRAALTAVCGVVDAGRNRGEQRTRAKYPGLGAKLARCSPQCAPFGDTLASFCEELLLRIYSEQPTWLPRATRGLASGFRQWRQDLLTQRHAELLFRDPWLDYGDQDRTLEWAAKVATTLPER